MRRLGERLLADIRADLAADRLVLPSLPDLALQIWTTLESPRASAGDVARLVGRDPALSARLLRVANSAYFPGTKPVSDLKRAVARLGNQLLRHMVAILEVAQVYELKGHPLVRPHLINLWHRATLVASLSELIATEHSHLYKETAFLAGLTHRIGELPVLVRAEKTPRLVEDDRILQPLVDALYPVVGAAILKRWRFPPELQEVPEGHVDLERESVGLADYVDIVQVAVLATMRETAHPLAQADWSEVPSVTAVGLEPETIMELRDYAGAKAADFRRLLAT